MNIKTIEKFPYLNTLIQIQLDRLIGRKKVQTIIDVGAFNGNFDVHLARLYKKAVIHALEPCSVAYEKLCEVSRKYPNVVAHRIAISDVDGAFPLYMETTKELSQSSTLFEEKGMKVEQVTCTTLSIFCSQFGIDNIDLLLLNCEGAEYLILEHGASLRELYRVRVLSLVLHGKDFRFLTQEYVEKKRLINKRLLKMGFKLVYGENLNGLDRLPVSHIQQVWIKE